MRRIVSLPVLLVLTTCAHDVASDHTNAPPLEIVGRVQNVLYEPIEDEGNLLGSGWITARITVVRTLRGRLAASELTARYYGHFYLDEDRPRRLRLTINNRGENLICTAVGGEGVRC